MLNNYKSTPCIHSSSLSAVKIVTLRWSGLVLDVAHLLFCCKIHVSCCLNHLRISFQSAMPLIHQFVFIEWDLGAGIPSKL